MAVYSIYILSKSGGLIYNYDQFNVKIEVEKKFNYPVPLILYQRNKKIVVAFGQKGGIKVGYVLLSINGNRINDCHLKDGRNVFEMLQNEENFPVDLLFSAPYNTVNDKIFLASMFYPLYALSCQLSPEPHSSGIEQLNADGFKLHCFQTPTGIKFLLVVSPKFLNADVLLKKLYELYSDFALKNPFYSLEMPIRSELFDSSVQMAIEQAEKSSVNLYVCKQ